MGHTFFERTVKRGDCQPVSIYAEAMGGGSLWLSLENPHNEKDHYGGYIPWPDAVALAKAILEQARDA